MPSPGKDGGKEKRRAKGEVKNERYSQGYCSGAGGPHKASNYSLDKETSPNAIHAEKNGPNNSSRIRKKSKRENLPWFVKANENCQIFLLSQAR